MTERLVAMEHTEKNIKPSNKPTKISLKRSLAILMLMTFSLQACGGGDAQRVQSTKVADVQTSTQDQPSAAAPISGGGGPSTTFKGQSSDTTSPATTEASTSKSGGGNGTSSVVWFMGALGVIGATIGIAYLATGGDGMFGNSKEKKETEEKEAESKESNQKISDVSRAESPSAPQSTHAPSSAPAANEVQPASEESKDSQSSAPGVVRRSSWNPATGTVTFTTKPTEIQVLPCNEKEEIKAIDEATRKAEEASK